MAQWIYTAQYDSTIVEWDSRTGTTERMNVSSISEIITATNEAEARQAAEMIATRNRNAGRQIRDEQLRESVPFAAAPSQAIKPTPEISAPRPERPMMTCRRCGADGKRGTYPFSTLPSSGMCDDCV